MRRKTVDNGEMFREKIIGEIEGKEENVFQLGGNEFHNPRHGCTARVCIIFIR